MCNNHFAALTRNVVCHQKGRELKNSLFCKPEVGTIYFRTEEVRST